jgi:hypothetical protein
MAARPAFDTVGTGACPEQAIVESRQLHFSDASSVVDVGQDAQWLEFGQFDGAGSGQLESALKRRRITCQFL